MKIRGTAESADNNFGLHEVGMRLREERAKVGMTRKQLAEASGTSERYLAHLEAGTGNPTLTILFEIANALDIAVLELLPWGGERHRYVAQVAAAVRRLPRSRLRDLMAWIDQPRTSLRRQKGRRIVLIGLRGAGKSTLGRMLAERLDMPFIEISKQIEAAYGGSIGVLLEMGGQASLRRYEHLAWERIYNDHDAAVVAAPGGIVADPTIYDRILSESHTIWLQANPEDHMKRVMQQGDFRPMSDDGKGAMDDLKAILVARTSEYQRAEAQLDTSTGGLEATLQRLFECASGMIGQASAGSS